MGAMEMSNIAVRSGTILWATVLIFGVLFWLASVGAWTNAAYTFALMLAAFSWFGYVVRDRAPKSS